MVLSTDAKKPPEKTQHPFMIKTINKLEIELPQEVDKEYV